MNTKHFTRLMIIILIISTFLTMTTTKNADSDNTRSTILTNGSIKPFKIMTYNIMESGADPDWKKVVQEENADVIMFVETGDWDDDTGDGFTHADFENLVSELNSYFPDETPYVAYSTQNIPYDTSGETIFSRFPVIDVNQLDTVILDDSTTFWPSHDFLDTQINVSGVNIHVIGAHLKCCSGETNEEKREKAQEGLNNYMDDLGEVPIIYLGDLNTFSPQDTGDLAPCGDLGFGVISMLINQSNSRSCKKHLFTDVYRTIHPSDPGYSFGWDSNVLRSRIDYIFVNEFLDQALINSTVGDTASAEIASDHFSVDAFLYPSEDILTTTSTTITTTTTPTTTLTSIVTDSSPNTSENTNSQSFNKTTPLPILAIVFGLVYRIKKRTG